MASVVATIGAKTAEMIARTAATIVGIVADRVVGLSSRRGRTNLILICWFQGLRSWSG
jgi:hypothetical protein